MKASQIDVSSLRASEGSRAFGMKILVAGLIVLGLGFAAGMAQGDGMRGFGFAYLLGATYVLSLGIGGLFFVILQHLTRAGWSAAVRRIAEMSASSLTLAGVLFLPLLIPTIFGYSGVWWWIDGDRAAADVLVGPKMGYLNATFFLIRSAFYFAVLIGMARYLVSRSLKQDETGDPELSATMRARSAPMMAVFALVTTFVAFDFLMSLDPHWFSTIFGVYFFAGCTLANFSLMVLVLNALRKRNAALAKAVTVEHYHDLGKWMFAFTFFWGYIAFSQFMLIWYANVPEETIWFEHRGLKLDHTGPWTWVSVVLLFGHFLIPFGGLLSRHVKRNPKTLGFWAIWVLAAHAVDLFWLIRPQLHQGDHAIHFNHVDVLAPIGLLLIFVGYAAMWFSGKSLLAARDPRLQESLDLVNQ